MPGQVPEEVKNVRSGQAIGIANKMRKVFLSGMVGRTVEVLTETVDPAGFVTGHTGNYVKVYISKSEGTALPINEIVRVQAKGLRTKEDGLIAKVFL